MFAMLIKKCALRVMQIIDFQDSNLAIDEENLASEKLFKLMPSEMHVLI